MFSSQVDQVWGRCHADWSEIVHTLRDLQRWCGGPVTSPLVADHLGLSGSTTRKYLSRLERAGLVERPAGPRSGWMTR